MATETKDKKQIWHQVLESIKVSVSSAIFSTWFSQTYLVSLKKTDKKRYLAEVGCPSPFVKSTIETRYFGLIQDALIKTIDAPCDLTFKVSQLPEEKAQKSTPSPLFDQEIQNNAFLDDLSRTNIRPGLNFANFAVSPTNQMAWAAAEAVAKTPGEAYNPLFIWGGVGVGKTHLMNAVGYDLIRRGLGSKILFCTGENFTNEIIESIRQKNTPAFRNKYRKLKAILIDDIQFIAGKDTVQDEFFHTFNAVANSGGQIIMTSDQPPSKIARLEDRLRSRFEAGLIVDISQPDFELRCAIVQIKVKERGLELTSDQIQLIASNIDSAREIQGFVVRLMSESKLRKMEINEDLIASLISKKKEKEVQRVRATTPEEVIKAVCNYYSVNKTALFSKVRARSIARPRQILMYLLRTELGIPFQRVGQMIGDRDHTTVIHAVKAVTDLASSNPQVREDLLGIKKVI